MLESLERELISPTVLTNILNAYINDMHENACIIVKGTKPYRYGYIDTNKIIMIDHFKKDKNLLVFSNADNTKSVSYDFNTHKITLSKTQRAHFIAAFNECKKFNGLDITKLKNDKE